MCYISVRPARHSYGIIKRDGCFVINLTTRALAYAADWCGVKSGKDHDKFREMGLTPVKAIKSEGANDKGISGEYRMCGKGDKGAGLASYVHLGSCGSPCRKEFYDEESGIFRLIDAEPISYLHGKYYETGKLIGKFGFSVEKKKKKKKKQS